MTNNQAELLYKAFIDKEKPFDFFKGLIRYIECVFLTPVLKKEFDEQIAKRRLLYEDIENLEQNIRKDLNKVKTKLLKLINKNKLNPNLFKREYTFPSDNGRTIIQDLELYEGGGIRGSVFVSDDISKHLLEIAVNILKAGFKKDIKEFITEDKPTYCRFVFSNLFDERNTKVSQFEQERLFQPWGSFELLLQFKSAFKHMLNLREMPSGTESVSWFGEVKEILKIYEMAQELNDLSDSEMDFYSKVNHSYTKNNINLKSLNQTTFKNASEIVHNHLMQIMVGNEGIKNNLYISKSGDDFSYKGVYINMSKKSDYYKVFSALYALAPTGGDVSYQKLSAEIKSRIPKTKNKTLQEMQKFVQRNLTDKSNGFMRYALIPKTEDNGKALISLIRGSSVVFNNRPQ